MVPEHLLAAPLKISHCLVSELALIKFLLLENAKNK